MLRVNNFEGWRQFQVVNDGRILEMKMLASRKGKVLMNQELHALFMADQNEKTHNQVFILVYGVARKSRSMLAAPPSLAHCNPWPGSKGQLLVRRSSL